ncbi:MAG: TldD/PmbA family protein [archaeon]|nr:TldD/PmbA family protein [archaeon]
MIPTDALDRLLQKADVISNACKSAGVEQWDIIGMQSYNEGVEIEAGKISLAGGGGDGGFGIRVVDKGRFGFAHLVDVQNVSSAIELAKKIANISPQIQGFDLPSFESTKKVDGMFDKSIVATSSEDILAHVASKNEYAIVTGGGIEVSTTASCLISSSGIEESGESTINSIGVQLSIDKDTFSSSYDHQSSRVKLDNIPHCVDNALYWAEMTQNPIKHNLSAEEAKVIFTPSAFSSLFKYIVPNSVIGERVARNISVWSNQMGKQVIDPHLTITNHGRLEGGLASSSRDDEGVPTQILPLIKQGVLMNTLWSVRDAAEMVQEGKVESAQTTGSAFRSSYQSPPATSCSEMILETTKKQHSRAELLDIINTGYIIQDVMGAHTANPTSGDFSVTSSTILRVENGEIVGPLSQAGISGNLISALQSNVELGNEISVRGRFHLTDVALQSHIKINPA